MTSYGVIVDEQDDCTFALIGLTLERDGTIYKVMARAHDEDETGPILHTQIV